MLGAVTADLQQMLGESTICSSYSMDYSRREAGDARKLLRIADRLEEMIETSRYQELPREDWEELHRFFVWVSENIEFFKR